MEEILKKIDEQNTKIDAIYESVDKLRKYFLWMLIITIVTIVAPLILMIFAIPTIMATFSSAYGL